ncbi:sugar phosphate isomerase/epimerase family protein [Pseudooctadecabacter sp.]|uniref:sugar phosphate isomerase/epimerase family protein n=1 Tax=Pseudooctadecabacter sp. TaxID=1966338 RepID=UPI0035C86A0D
MTPALQLYSMRDFHDQIVLLAELPTLGITTVEGYGGVYQNPDDYRIAMDRHGVSMPSGHVALDDIEADFDATMKRVTTLGIRRVFAPFLAPEHRPDTAAGWTALADRLNTAARRFADRGITFGWHNHDFEFAPLDDGRVPMDILLTSAPDIVWEADLAWIVRAGRDPLAYVKKYGDRLSAVHVKDIAAQGTNLDQDGWADLGAGTVNWAALLQACKDASPDLIYALEHDKPADPLAFAAASAAAFDTLWGATHD